MKITNYLLAAMFLAITFPAHADTDENTAAAVSEPSVQVETVPLSRQLMSSSITAYGTLQADPQAAVNIVLPRAAIVQSVHAQAGQAVKAGDVLLELTDDPESAAIFSQAKSTATYAATEVERQRRLVSQHLATQSQLEAAQRELVTAQSTLQTQNSLGAGQNQITAPSDGIVTALNLTVGDRLAAGTMLATLAPAGSLVILMQVAAPDAERVQVGDAVEVKPAFGSSDPVNARVSTIAQAIDPTTHMIEIKATLQDGVALSNPGSTMRCAIKSAGIEHYTVPLSAVLEDETGSYLYVTQDGVAKRIAIEALAQQGDQIAITGPLADTMKIVKLGNYELQDGMRIQELAP